MRSRSRDGRHSRGSVTAELALAMPSVVLVLAVVVCVGQVVTAQVRCTDAARAAARLAARGESTDRVAAAAVRLGPGGSRVNLRRSGGQVVVEVEATLRVPLPGAPAVTISGDAAAAVETSPDAAVQTDAGAGVPIAGTGAVP